MKSFAELHHGTYDAYDASENDASDANDLKPVTEYRTPAKVFHWLTAVLVLVMVCSGVIGKQLDGGGVSDALMELHKTTGVLTLCVVLMRLAYRLMSHDWAVSTQSNKRPVIHWTLYAVIVCLPLLGWAGASDFGARDILFGYALPAIWPEGSGYGDVLLRLHAYLAFTLLGLVTLHIGLAMQDYMTRARSRSGSED